MRHKILIKAVATLQCVLIIIQFGISRFDPGNYYSWGSSHDEKTFFATYEFTNNYYDNNRQQKNSDKQELRSNHIPPISSITNFYYKDYFTYLYYSQDVIIVKQTYLRSSDQKSPPHDLLFNTVEDSRVLKFI